MGREDWDIEERLGGGKVGMRRKDWNGKGRLGWGGKFGMGRENWRGEERLGWGGKIWMGREDWDGKGRLGWGGIGPISSCLARFKLIYMKTTGLGCFYHVYFSKVQNYGSKVLGLSWNF